MLSEKSTSYIISNSRHRQAPVMKSRSSEDLSNILTLTHLFEFDHNKADSFARQLIQQKLHCSEQLGQLVLQLEKCNPTDSLASQLRNSARMIIETPLVSLTDTELVQDLLKSTRTVAGAEKYRDYSSLTLASKFLIIVAPLARLLRTIEQQRTLREENLARSGFSSAKVPRRTKAFPPSSAQLSSSSSSSSPSSSSLSAHSPSSYSSSSSSSSSSSPSPSSAVSPSASPSSSPSQANRPASPRSELVRSAASFRVRGSKGYRAATLLPAQFPTEKSPRQAIKKDLLQFSWMHMPKSLLTTQADLRSLRPNLSSVPGSDALPPLSSSLTTSSDNLFGPERLSSSAHPLRSQSVLSSSSPMLPWLQNPLSPSPPPVRVPPISPVSDHETTPPLRESSLTAIFSNPSNPANPPSLSHNTPNTPTSAHSHRTLTATHSATNITHANTHPHLHPNTIHATPINPVSPLHPSPNHPINNSTNNNNNIDDNNNNTNMTHSNNTFQPIHSFQQDPSSPLPLTTSNSQGSIPESDPSQNHDLPSSIFDNAQHTPTASDRQQSIPAFSPLSVPSLDISRITEHRVSTEVSPTSQLASSPLGPDTSVCRICEQEIPEHLFLLHTDACSALAQREVYLIELMYLDQELQRIALLIKDDLEDMRMKERKYKLDKRNGASELTAPVSQNLATTKRRLQTLHKVVSRARTTSASTSRPLQHLQKCISRLENLLQKRDISATLHNFVRSLEAKLDTKMKKLQFVLNSAALANPEMQKSLQLRVRHPPSIQDFDIIRGIGKGAFGRVYLVSKKQTGDIYALKVLRKEDIIRRRQETHTQTEQLILARVNNPFVTKLYYSFQSNEKLFMVLEYASGGDLNCLLNSLNCLDEQTTKRYVAEIVLALEYLHSQRIIHRDLKPDNILINHDGHLKLSDFGLSFYSEDIFDPNHRKAEPSPDKLSATPSLLSSSGTMELDFDLEFDSDFDTLQGATPGLNSSTNQLHTSRLRRTSMLRRSNSTHQDPTHLSAESLPLEPEPNPPHVHSLTPLSMPLDIRPSPRLDAAAPHAAELLSPLHLDSEKALDAVQPDCEDKTPLIGTPNYIAPEVIIGAKHGHEVDWWALGIIMYECLTGCPPFSSDNVVELFSQILNGKIDWSPLESEVSVLAIDLMQKLLQSNPKERLGHNGAAEVKQHPYFSDIDWATLLTEKALFIPKLDDPTDTTYFGDVEVKNLSFEDLDAMLSARPSDSCPKISASDSNSSSSNSSVISAKDPSPLILSQEALFPSSSFDAFDFVNYQALSALDKTDHRKKTDPKSPLSQVRQMGRERAYSNPEPYIPPHPRGSAESPSLFVAVRTTSEDSINSIGSPKNPLT